MICWLQKKENLQPPHSPFKLAKIKEKERKKETNLIKPGKWRNIQLIWCLHIFLIWCYTLFFSFLNFLSSTWTDFQGFGRAWFGLGSDPYTSPLAWTEYKSIGMSKKSLTASSPSCHLVIKNLPKWMANQVTKTRRTQGFPAYWRVSQ